MADTLTYNKNNVYYVDPSDAFVQMDGDNKHYVTPDTEDMCIAVDLEVECPKRYNRTNGISKFVLQWTTKSGESTNFLGGTPLTDSSSKTTLRYLTSDGNEYVYGDGRTQEMFGIKSIHIDYSTFFVPNITMEFSDVRGASLFTIEEAAHQACTNGIEHSLNSVDVTRSFFECFFRFPYPTFRLKVKGLYGKPASYELTVAKCNHALDAATGSYNVTATFIGYTYSLLNDITMNALIAAPDAQDWGVDYWTSNFSNRTLPDGSGTYKKISEMVAGMAGAARRADELDRQTQRNNESYNKRIADIVAMRDALTDIIKPDGLLERYYKNATINNQSAVHVYSDGQCMLVVNEHSKGSIATAYPASRRPFSPFAKNDSGDGYVDPNIQNTKAEVIKLREAYQKFTDAYNQYVTDKAQEDPEFSFGDIDRLTKNSGAYGGIDVYSMRAGASSNTKVISVTNKTDYQRIKGILSSSATIDTAFRSSFAIDGTGDGTANNATSQIIPTVVVSAVVSEPDCCFIDTIDYSDAITKLNDTEQMLRNSLQAENDQSDLSGLYVDCLGFKPTIENIMAIVMAHFEVLLYGIKTCEDNVYSLLNSGNRKSTNLEAGATVPPMTDGNVPPFPEVFTTDKYGKRIRTWIGASGINTTYAPEKELIETLLEAVDTIEQKIEEAMRTESESSLANLNSGTAEVPFPVSVIDFIKVRKPGEESNANTVYSPFGKSINSVLNGLKNDRQKALANILKARWLNLGDSVNDKEGSGRADAHNLMVMHREEITSLDTLLDTVSDTSGDKLSKLASEVCGKVNGNIYAVPAAGYSLPDVKTEASLIDNGHLAAPFDTKYSLYEKKETWKYQEIAYYRYAEYLDGIKAVEDANAAEWKKPDFYAPVEDVDSIELELEGMHSVNELTTNSGVAVQPLGKDFRAVYNVDNNQFIVSTQTTDRNTPESAPLSYFDSAYIIGMGPVFAHKNYYETDDIDEQAEIFLREVSLRFKRFGRNQDNETALVANYAYVLWLGNQERLIRDGKVHAVGGGRACYDGVVKTYEAWRDTTFKNIKDKYELRKNGVRLTGAEVDVFYNFILTDGEKVKDTQHASGGMTVSVNTTNAVTGHVLDCSDKPEQTGKFIDYNWFKETYGLKLFARDTNTTTTIGSRTFTYPREITLFAKKNDFLESVSHELLAPVIVFKKDKIKDAKKTSPDDYGLDDDYADGFITELKKLIEAEKESAKNSPGSETLARANNAAAEDMEEDIRVTLYTYIKTLYDKWLCGNGDYPKKYGINEFFSKHFYFIDSFYNKIGDDLIVNIKHVLEEIDNSRRNKAMSMLEFITSVSSKNLVQTLCVQNFSDFSDSEHNVLERAFKPLAYNDASMDTVTSLPDFVFIYANQPSQHIDIKSDGDYEYKNDGFHLSCDDSISDLCIDSKRQGKIPAFGVKYGSLYQHFFHDLQVGMDSSMATEQSMAAMFAIANINQNSDSGEILSPIGQDLYTIYSNNSYSCKLRMMGSAWVQPLMYFDLLNVPMFHGSYMIKKVTHSITPGDMVTEVVGVRQANVANKFVEQYMLARRGTYAQESRAFAGSNAKPTNNCAYQMFDPRESDMADADNNHTTNIVVLKSLKTEHDGKMYTYYDLITNQVLGATQAAGHLDSSKSFHRTTIPLMTGVMYSRIKWYNKDMGGWANVLKATTDFPYMYTTFKPGSIPKDVMASYIREIDGVLNNSPSSLVGVKDGVTLNGAEHKITAGDLSTMTHYSLSPAKLDSRRKPLFTYQGKINLYGPYKGGNIMPCYEVGTSDAVKRVRDRSITDRTAEEEPYSDIAVGLQRSIKKTCKTTDALEGWNPKFTQELTDSSVFIIENLANKDMADSMFDMLLNTYYEYIARLDYILDKNIRIRVGAANLVDGTGPTKTVKLVQSNGQTARAGTGDSKEPFTNGFLNAIYKKYLIGVNLDNIPNGHVFLKECDNFKTNVTKDRLKKLFGDIKIEQCPVYTVEQYNDEYKASAEDIKNGGYNDGLGKSIAPGVSWNPLKEYCFSGNKRNPITTLVIHFAGSANSKAGYATKGIWKVFDDRCKKKKGKGSADFAVDDVGMVQLNPDPVHQYTFAAGKCNSYSVSIEIASSLKKRPDGKYYNANVYNHSGWYFTKASYENAVKLATIIMKKYNIPKKNVIRHCDCMDKDCPGVVGWNTRRLHDPITGELLDERNNDKKWKEFLSRLPS